MEEQHAKKYIKTDDASRKKLCEAIDRGSILNEAALTLGIPKQTAQRIYKRYLDFESFAASNSRFL